jgi:hypothetical protein
LEIPPEDTSAPQGAKEASKPAPTEAPKPAESKPSKPAGGPAPTGATAQKQRYPLYPAVQHLLRENNLPLEEADKIPASGPGGRLLKGDVLAYLGRVEKDYAANLSKRIADLGHLDLSNVKVVAPAQPPVPATPAEAVTPEAEAEELLQSLSLPVSLKAVLDVQERIEETIGVHLPVSTFVARATELANEDLPRASQAASKDLFRSLVGAPVPKTSRGSYVPQFAYFGEGPLPLAGPRAKSEPDPFDLLTGKATPARRAPLARPATAEAGEMFPAVFSIDVAKGEERRAKVFLERLKLALQTEPGRLVL